MTIKILKTVDELKAFSKDVKSQNKTFGLVPTMGTLHDGHLSLVNIAQEKAGIVIASVFVNPTQFGPNEDLDAYPRQLEQDVELLKEIGCDGVFCPNVDQMYPDGFATNIHVSDITNGLCGDDRPGHFDGVATVVAKLLIQSAADIAVFGEKDYQQLCIIKRLAKDLDIDCKIIGGPIIRDEHGLALSSRNNYLNENELAIARQFNSVLKQTIKDLKQSGSPVSAIAKAKQALLKTGAKAVDYFDLREEDTLKDLSSEALVHTENVNCRLIAAIRVGKARLLDNMRVE